ncbi:hypothetical protein SNOG_06818 [Parastagonospora nodorum SN15]|uniref:ZIC1-5/GLI1-3like C2H2 zinc finger domain-containing protein n=1 Tax=Phaeosphaeria nodorum (strain SN15 / ATCC MYA-4574 / FGSC 10173) TaxID=321614 RepID=Q0UN46_PHANO|nr:hypothetical protein SNOG_06818 [Parastagonospora nodorum SN15]EAT85469.2 hypothetical protein SNOG_06818 [Parastagonospora nodorum SN15]
MESPGSDLSDYASDDFPEDVKGRQRSDMEPTPDQDAARPSKRLRLNQRAPSSPPPPITVPPLDDDDPLSEDTDGSVPASPNHHPGMSQDLDEFGQDQVTVCKWEGCEAGDLENMDNLVEHLHDDHIGTRQKKYSCEWSDCTRKGIPHASGYALRAHMRSHTREKPFYCTLPDALAKHMRTVHETEALRPSDPVPKHHSSNPSNNKQRIRLILNANEKKPEKGSAPASPASHSHPTNSAPIPPASDVDYAHNNVTYIQDLAAPGAPTMVQFPPDIVFTERELSLPAPELFQLLRRQLQWAQQESEQLRAEADALEKVRKEEWEAKELLVENLMEAQVATERRQRVERGEPEDYEGMDAVEQDVAPARALPIKPKDGKLPWWRDPQQVMERARQHPRPPPSDIRRETSAA